MNRKLDDEGLRTREVDSAESMEGSHFDTTRERTIERLEQQLVTAADREARRARFSQISSPIATVVGILVFWQVIVGWRDTPTYLVPQPTLVAEVFVEQWPLLMEHSVPTMSAMLVGFVMAIVVGFVLAVLTYTFKPFERGFYPLLVSMQAVPKIAIAPLFAIWFGFSIWTKSGMAFLLAVFPVVINTLVGLRSIPPEKVFLARAMGLGPIKIFMKIRFPQALPSIFGGAKVALAMSFIGAVIGEFVGGGSGLGYLIQRANVDLATPMMFAALMVLATYAIILFLVLEAIERVWLPWHLERRPVGI